MLEWRRYAYRWSAFVAYVILTGDHQPERVVTEWIPISRLRAVKSHPDRLSPF